MRSNSSLSVRMMRTFFMTNVCLGLTTLGLLGCNGYDPVPQAIIDSLPPETGTPSATHRAGQPCLQCHSAYGAATPELVIGGSVFKEDPMVGLKGAPGIKVIVYDSTGDSRVACTNSGGNFYIEKTNWEGITFPLKSFVGNVPRRMQSIIGREGSCGNCHKLPPKGTMGTGEAHDSPGVIIVEDGEESPELCPGVP